MKRKKNNHTKITVDIQKNDYIIQLQKLNEELSARASNFLTMIMICPSTKKIVDILKDNKEVTPEEMAELKSIFLDPIAFPDDEKNTEIILNFLMQIKFHLPELGKLLDKVEKENPEIIIENKQVDQITV